jgi:hypothetical protein
MRKMLTAAALAAFLPSCSGGSGGAAPPPGPSVTETRTFTGTTRALSATSCGGDSHDFEAREGTIAVTLVQSTDGTALGVQVCAGGIDNNDCSINQTRIAVGQTVSGTRRGAAQQNLKLLPVSCSPAGGPVPPGPISYTATVSFQR